MPRRSGDQAIPAAYVTGEFADGLLTADAPAGVAEAQALAQNLRDAVAATGTSISELARTAGVDRTVIYDILAGNAYISGLTLARLERTLGTALWPGPTPPARR